MTNDFAPWNVRPEPMFRTAVRHDTDWLSRVQAKAVDPASLRAQASAEADAWVSTKNAMVLSDKGELTVQAVGYADLWAGQFGPQAYIARMAFLARLNRTVGVVHPEDDEYDEYFEEDRTTRVLNDAGVDTKKVAYRKTASTCSNCGGPVAPEDDSPEWGELNWCKSCDDAAEAARAEESKQSWLDWYSRADEEIKSGYAEHFNNYQGDWWKAGSLDVDIPELEVNPEFMPAQVTDMVSTSQPFNAGEFTVEGNGNTNRMSPQDWDRFYNGDGVTNGVPRDLFPQGGVPLHGDLTPEQEAWLKSRKSSRTADLNSLSPEDLQAEQASVEERYIGRRFKSVTDSVEGTAVAAQANTFGGNPVLTIQWDDGTVSDHGLASIVSLGSNGRFSRKLGAATLKYDDAGDHWAGLLGGDDYVPLPWLIVSNDGSVLGAWPTEAAAQQVLDSGEMRWVDYDSGTRTFASKTAGDWSVTQGVCEHCGHEIVLNSTLGFWVHINSMGGNADLPGNDPAYHEATPRMDGAGRPMRGNETFLSSRKTADQMSDAEWQQLLDESKARGEIRRNGPMPQITNPETPFTVQERDSGGDLNENWIGLFTDDALSQAIQFWTEDAGRTQPNLPGYDGQTLRFLNEERTRRHGSLRPINEIAADIRQVWGAKVQHTAAPFLDAMSYVARANDKFYTETGADLVKGFLRSSSAFKHAGLKAELAAHVKTGALSDFEVAITNKMTNAYVTYQLDEGRYVHYFNGPTVDNKRVVLYESEGGIGSPVETVPVSSDAEAEQVVKRMLGLHPEASRKTAEDGMVDSDKQSGEGTSTLPYGVSPTDAPENLDQGFLDGDDDRPLSERISDAYKQEIFDGEQRMAGRTAVTTEAPDGAQIYWGGDDFGGMLDDDDPDNDDPNYPYEGNDDPNDDWTRTSRRRTASTCADCGSSIEEDPAGESNRGWHHNDGSSHDHEAKPAKEGSHTLRNLERKEWGMKPLPRDEDDEKTSSRRTAAGDPDLLPWQNDDNWGVPRGVDVMDPYASANAEYDAQRAEEERRVQEQIWGTEPLSWEEQHELEMSRLDQFGASRRTAAVIPDATVERLRGAITPLMTPEVTESYRSGNFDRADAVKDLDKRYRWDLFWAAVNRDRSLMDEINGLRDGGVLDSHIDTALRNIVPKLGSRRTALSEDRQRQVDGIWAHQTGAWDAPFETLLNDVMVSRFYDDDDYDDVKAYFVQTKSASRRTAASYGEQAACAICDMDIEYHGPDEGWIGRGGDHTCRDSGGMKPRDEWGDLTGEELPDTPHRPYTGSRRTALPGDDNSKPAGAAPQVPTLGLDDEAMFEAGEIEGDWDESTPPLTEITSGLNAPEYDLFG